MTSSGSGWAKAPVPGNPDALARLREATEADREEHLRDRLRPVDCLRCGTCVLVKKNSPKHTSIQWTTEPAASCAEFAERAARGENSALIETCPDLRTSIDRAAREGRLEHPDQG